MASGTGYLVNPIVADARTEITTELSIRKRLRMLVEAEEGIRGAANIFLPRL